MKQSLGHALLAGLGLVFASSIAFAAPLNLDRTHSKIGFTAETLLFEVDGEFTEYLVEVIGDPNQPEQAKIKVRIEVASIDTGNEKRDNHLRSPDFFDAASHPTITFESRSVRKKGEQLIVDGFLKMRGTTNPVTIPFSIAKGKNGAGAATTAYKGKITIDRTAYGIGTDSIAAKISLEDDVDLKLLIVTFDP